MKAPTFVRKKTVCLLLALPLFACASACRRHTAPGPEEYAVRMAESVMVRHPDRYYGWDYVTGVMTKAFELLWLETGDDRFRQYVVKTVDPVIAEDGTMASVEMAILEDGRK